MHSSERVGAVIMMLAVAGLVFAAGESPTMPLQLLSAAIGIAFWTAAYLLYKKYERLWDDDVIGASKEAEDGR